MSYVELLAKSNFTFLRGASHPHELIETALTQGLRGLALGDRNGLYGVGRAYANLRSQQDVSAFHFLVAAELSFIDHPPLTLIARHREGYGLLCRLLSLSHADKPKGRAFLHFRELCEFLQGRTQGLVALPTNPLKGRSFQEEDRPQYGVLRDLFQDQIFVPLIRYLDGRDRIRHLEVERVTREFQILPVASNDVYYHEKKRKLIQDVLISIAEGKPLNQVGYALSPNAERYLKSPAQMQKLFADHLDYLARTVEIAQGCHFSLSELRYHYPSEWIPQGFDAPTYLEHLVQVRAQELYQGQVPEKVQRQLQHELGLIRELNYADYFLTIYDIVEFARSREILCQGRGSAANSAVCYVLGITAIDPVQMGLLFERFISAERGEPPDIDVDFEHERREEVIQYIYSKYGRERAAMVSAVITYRGRSALREVAKAFGVPVGTLSAKKVERRFDELLKDLNAEERIKLREKIDIVATAIRGFPRHLTIHSGGFTLSAHPIIEIVPIEPARMSGRTIIQWDKYDLDTLGLLKIDVLSLGMLSCLRKTLQMVGKKLYEIPHDDTATYEMIQRCDTVGTFQIESRAQMSMLGRLLPRNFYDLVIEVAIVRPGPIVGQMVHPYLKRRRGLEKIDYPNEKVRSILEKTLGVPLFQEQVMKMAIELAGFTPGEADRLRRSINAWRTSDSIGEMGQRLMQGLIQSGLPRSFAEQIFKQIQGFSEYGFPESHAASFALLAYASCYLKCHHPAEFACSLINSQPMGFYRNDTILYDAIRHGVRILPLSFNESEWDCTVVQGGTPTIRLGFRLAHGLSRKEADLLIQHRPFHSLQDLYTRARVRRDVLERLALAGRFHDFELEPRQALWTLLEYQNLFSNEPTQLQLFSQTEQEAKPLEKTFAPQTAFEKIQEDYEAFSVSTQGHPMQELRRQLRHLPKSTSRELRQIRHGQRVSAAGLILIRQKPPTAKGVVFSTLEDEFGFIDLILHGPVYERHREVFLTHCFIIIRGKLQRDQNTVSVLVEEVKPIWANLTPESTPLHLEPTQYFYS